jgi:cytochrome P450
LLSVEAMSLDLPDRPRQESRMARRRRGVERPDVTLVLPDGPRAGRLAQTVALHRDPLGVLRAARRRHGDVFTINLLTPGPTVIVADAALAAGLPESDPRAAHAGVARRAVLPMASPDSVFGGDEEAHATARAAQEPWFAHPDRAAIATIAREHVARWPRGRPFRLLPRMRALADEVFVREALGVRGPRADALVHAIGRLLWTPGNPPITIPAPDQGLMGRVVDAEYRRRRARVVALLADEDLGDPDMVLSTFMAAQEPMAAALTRAALTLANAGVAPDDAAIREALRLHPPAFAILRELTEPRVLGGHALPVGTATAIPIALVQRDPRWHGPDAEAFRVDRPEPPAHAYFPFGGGARRCLGEPLARAELATILPLLPRLRPVGPQPERAVLRGTILVPRCGGVVVARHG